MEPKYLENAAYGKAFADPNRLAIIDMLSGGELCACKILEKLGISQPTLSHHMKILCDCSVVLSRKDGKWMHYTLNQTTIASYLDFLKNITANKQQCICKE